MKTKHTPGPWNTVMDGCETSHGLPVITKINGHLVAPLCDRNEANARLIAAAPDLLTALTSAINDLEFRANYDESNRLPKLAGQANFWMRSHIDGTRAVAAAGRAAIAKATGEA